MKKVIQAKRTHLFLILVIMSLAGCSNVGRGDPVHEINMVLDSYVAAYIAANTSALANFYSYPTKQIDEHGEAHIMRSREEMASTLAVGFLFVEVHDLQWIDRSIHVSGNTAVVTMLAVSDVTVLGARQQNQKRLELTLVDDGGWKIAVLKSYDN